MSLGFLVNGSILSFFGVMGTVANKNAMESPSTTQSQPGSDRPTIDKNSRVAIIGAGMAGLYAAMILRSLGFTNYVIFEANNRAGGRIILTRLELKLF
jgi:NADPH-dependent glutamate synthase beta subunit-like oxidoreductase